MVRLTTVLALVLTLCGCTVGPRTAKFTPLKTAAGIQASLQLGSGTAVNGELLAVEEASLLVLDGGRVTRVPEAGIRSGSFEGAQIAIDGGRPLPSASRSKLALLSRFPQGVSPSLLAALLSAYGQAEVVAAR